MLFNAQSDIPGKNATFPSIFPPLFKMYLLLDDGIDIVFKLEMIIMIIICICHKCSIYFCVFVAGGEESKSSILFYLVVTFEGNRVEFKDQSWICFFFMLHVLRSKLMCLKQARVD